MVVMTGTKKVLHLIGIQCFIHRDREYILYGRFIEDREVTIPLTEEAVAILKKQKEKNKRISEISTEWEEFVFLC